MSWSTVLAVAAGGAIGSVARYGTMSAIGPWLGGTFPHATLAVNVLGSFTFGALVEIWAQVWSPSQELRALIAVGFLGGFTTFSTFSLDAWFLIERGDTAGAALYAVLSVVLSVGGFVAGLYLLRQVLG